MTFSGSLRLTRTALVVLRALAPVIGAFFALVLFVSITNGSELLSNLSSEREIPDAGGALIAFQAALFLAIGAIAALWVIVTQLLRIIDTVQCGDPFAPENAVRLRVVGIAFGVFVAAYAVAKAAVQFEVPTAGGVDWLAISPAVASVLLIFVLAEIFKEGARMREELEGTV